MTTSLWIGTSSLGRAATVSPQAEAAPTEAPTLLAQFAPYPGSSGITATGSGTATAPADSALIYFTYYSNYYPTPSEDPNAPPPLPPAVTAADMKPVVDAIVAAGVPAAGVEATADPSSMGSFRIRARMDRPTQATVQRVIAAANEAATKGGKYAGGGSQVAYLTNNCAAVENQARQNAIRDLQSRATALASAAGIQMGNMMSIAESSIWGMGYSPTCPSASDPMVVQNPYAIAPADLTVPPVVQVTSQVTATYEMKR
jgi:uncharacterized protein YggE